MPVFAKPKFSYSVDLGSECDHLRAHKKARSIPDRKADHLLVASWNVANFGVQQREDDHIALIAEVVSWFDVVALQEVRSNYADLERLVRTLGDSYRYLMSDVAGNDERMVFVYQSPKVQQLELVGEIAVPPGDHKDIKLPGIRRKFDGFDRNPYVVAFGVDRHSFLLANVHLYFGTEKTAAQKKASLERRSLEAFAVARWADIERKSKSSFTREIIALGDMNMPKRDPSDPVFKGITKRGLRVPEHSTKIASSIASDSEYDQIAVFPGATLNRLTAGVGVFDYDAVIFPDLWKSKTKAEFKSYLRYYVSDHRPVWMELAH